MHIKNLYGEDPTAHVILSNFDVCNEHTGRPDSGRTWTTRCGTGLAAAATTGSTRRGSATDATRSGRAGTATPGRARATTSPGAAGALSLALTTTACLPSEIQNPNLSCL